jgi:hypothetical protein
MLLLMARIANVLRTVWKLMDFTTFNRAILEKLISCVCEEFAKFIIVKQL